MLRFVVVLVTYWLVGLPVTDASAARQLEPMRHVFLGGQEGLWWDGGDLLVAAPYGRGPLLIVRESTGARFSVRIGRSCNVVPGGSQVADARVLLWCNAPPERRLLDLRTGMTRELKSPQGLSWVEFPWPDIGRHWIGGQAYPLPGCAWGCSIYRNLQTGELRQLLTKAPVDLDSVALKIRGCGPSVRVAGRALTLYLCGQARTVIYRGNFAGNDGDGPALIDGVVTWATADGVIGAYRVATGQRALWRVPIYPNDEGVLEPQDISVTQTRRHIYVGVASRWTSDVDPTPVNRRAYVGSLRRIGL